MSEQRERHERHALAADRQQLHLFDAEADFALDELLHRDQRRLGHQAMGAVARAPTRRAAQSENSVPAQLDLSLGARARDVQVDPGVAHKP